MAPNPKAADDGDPPELLSLTCHVQSAKLHTTSSSTFDPYVKILVLNGGGQLLSERKSMVVQHCTQPFFDFSENFFRDIVSDQLNGATMLKIEVWNKDYHNSNDTVLGQLEFDLKNAGGETFSDTYSLTLDSVKVLHTLTVSISYTNDEKPCPGEANHKQRVSPFRINVDDASTSSGSGDSPPSFTEYAGAEQKSEVGRLEIYVECATDVPKLDTFSQSDPFVTISVSGEEKKTSVVNNNANPVWNSELDFTRVRLEDNVKLHMWDYDFISRNDTVGAVEMTVRELLQRYGESDSQRQPLQMYAASGKRPCLLYLSVKFEDVVTTSVQSSSKPCINLRVDLAGGLSLMPSGKKSDPFLMAAVTNSSGKPLVEHVTGILQSTSEPTFNFHENFADEINEGLLEGAANLLLQVWNKSYSRDTVDSLLGEVKFDLAAIDAVPQSGKFPLINPEGGGDAGFLQLYVLWHSDSSKADSSNNIVPVTMSAPSQAVASKSKPGYTPNDCQSTVKRLRPSSRPGSAVRGIVPPRAETNYADDFEPDDSAVRQPAPPANKLVRPKSARPLKKGQGRSAVRNQQSISASSSPHETQHTSPLQSAAENPVNVHLPRPSSSPPQGKGFQHNNHQDSGIHLKLPAGNNNGYSSAESDDNSPMSKETKEYLDALLFSPPQHSVSHYSESQALTPHPPPHPTSNFSVSAPSRPRPSSANSNAVRGANYLSFVEAQNLAARRKGVAKAEADKGRRQAVAKKRREMAKSKLLQHQARLQARAAARHKRTKLVKKTQNELELRMKLKQYFGTSMDDITTETSKMFHEKNSMPGISRPTSAQVSSSSVEEGDIFSADPNKASSKAYRRPATAPGLRLYPENHPGPLGKVYGDLIARKLSGAAQDNRILNQAIQDYEKDPAAYAEALNRKNAREAKRLRDAAKFEKLCEPTLPGPGTSFSAPPKIEDINKVQWGISKHDNKMFNVKTKDPQQSLQMSLTSYYTLLEEMRASVYKSKTPSVVNTVLFGKPGVEIQKPKYKPPKFKEKEAKDKAFELVENGWNNSVDVAPGVPSYDSVFDEAVKHVATPEFRRLVRNTRSTMDRITLEKLNQRVKQGPPTLGGQVEWRKRMAMLKDASFKPAGDVKGGKGGIVRRNGLFEYKKKSIVKVWSPGRRSLRYHTSATDDNTQNENGTIDWFGATQMWAEHSSDLSTLLEDLLNDSTFEEERWQIDPTLRDEDQLAMEAVDLHMLHEKYQDALWCFDVLCELMYVPRDHQQSMKEQVTISQTGPVSAQLEHYKKLLAFLEVLKASRQKVYDAIDAVERRESVVKCVNSSKSKDEVNHWIGQLSECDKAVAQVLKEWQNALHWLPTDIFMYKGVDYLRKMEAEQGQVSFFQNRKDSPSGTANYTAATNGEDLQRGEAEVESDDNTVVLGYTNGLWVDPAKVNTPEDPHFLARAAAGKVQHELLQRTASAMAT